MKVFPFFHNIEGKTFLIVGGGRIAAEKVGRLLPFGADMHIVGTWISDEIRNMTGQSVCREERVPESGVPESEVPESGVPESGVLGNGVSESGIPESVVNGQRSALETDSAESASYAGRIRIEERAFEERDLDDADYCIAATDDYETNRRIHDLCKARKIPVNVVDTMEFCEFIFPSLIKHGDLTVAISTAGKSPAMGRYVKKQVEDVLPAETEDILNRLGALRSVLPGRISSQRERGKAYKEIMELLVATDDKATDEQIEQILRRHEDRRTCILATRGSALALAQAEEVKGFLEKKGIHVEIRTVSTGGDRDRTRPLAEIGGKGLFVKEVERELLEGRADIAVHSGKDLPYELAEGTVITGVPAAESSADCLLTRKGEELPDHPVIGTGSPRRIVQCRKFLPDAEYVSIRGNVDTRLRKLREGEYDGILLARAGMNRLHCDLSDLDVREFAPDEFIPAACQGILAIQCRNEDTELCRILNEISDPESAQRLQAERFMLQLTGADCSQSVGAHASLQNGKISMWILLGEREAAGEDAYERYPDLCRQLLEEVKSASGRITDDDAVCVCRAAGKNVWEVSGKESGIESDVSGRPGSETPDRRGIGNVTLVGCGCGRDLITVKGLRAVQQAEVLLYDDLLDSGVIAEAQASCEKIYVGKRSGRHSEPQDKIEELLVQKAKTGKRVVRLKGGDSFVFGRGGEEILALQKENIPYEVIPGVTSAVAVPGHAGIPVTHRGVAQSFTVITGHTATEKEEDYEGLAKLNGTLVFLMGLQNTAKIAERLMRYGKPADTPAVIISQGFAAGEKRITGTLDDIGEKAELAVTPAILVIGPTAGFHMEPTIRRPLEGVSATLVGTDRFIGKLSRLLEEKGAETDLRPVLRIRPLPENIPEDLNGYTWIVFTSVQGVKCFFENRNRKMCGRGLADAEEKSGKSCAGDIRELGNMRFAVIGEGTADGLAEYGILADFEPSAYTARALGKELPAHLAENDKVLILRAENGSPDLTEELDLAGVKYTDTVVYRTEADPSVFLRPAPQTEYIVFASAAGVRNYFDKNELSEKTVPVCIGPSTEKEFRRHSARKVLTAGKHTAEGIVDLLMAEKFTSAENE